jgi:hypothetical protein
MAEITDGSSSGICSTEFGFDRESSLVPFLSMVSDNT